MAKSLVIDFHAHMLEKDVLAQAQGKTVLSGFGTRPAADRNGAGAHRHVREDAQSGTPGRGHGPARHRRQRHLVEHGDPGHLVGRPGDRARARPPRATIARPNGAPRIRSASSAASCCRCRTSIARCARFERAVGELELKVANSRRELRRPLSRPCALPSVLGGGGAPRRDGVHPSRGREGPVVPGFRPVELGRPADRGGEGDVVDHLRGHLRPLSRP